MHFSDILDQSRKWKLDSVCLKYTDNKLACMHDRYDQAYHQKNLYNLRNIYEHNNI